MTDTRKSLRTQLRARRREIAPAQRIAAANALALRLLSLPFAPTRGHVAGYWASDGEIALHAWQLALPSGTTYCLPVLGDDQALRFAPWRPGEALSANRFGIPEPDVPPDRLVADLCGALAASHEPHAGFRHLERQPVALQCA